MACGAAPLSQETFNFIRILFCCQLFQGYGLTETNGGAIATHPQDIQVGHVGGPSSCVEYKLVDVPEMEYHSTDQIEGVPHPRGEICIRGPSVFTEYYKEPEKTKEVIDQDGFFHTGDLGMVMPHGGLKIIGRKKQIFKLSQGEYIAAEYLESVYVQNDLIKQIFVYGDSLQDYLVAVIVPDPEEFEKWAISVELEEMPYEKGVQSEKFKEAIFGAIEAQKKESSLNGFEVVKRFHITTEEFTITDNLLTPTFKVKRENALKKYIDEIKEMYDGAKLQNE